MAMNITLPHRAVMADLREDKVNKKSGQHLTKSIS
jgi:hypothetical protein